MTDNKIIKAFEICYTGDEEGCLNCPFCDEDGECMDMGDSKLLKEVGYLLNRQKAEIERYKGVIKILEKDVMNAKSEAMKYLAEDIKQAFYYEFDELIPSIMSDKIDELVNERVCKNDNERNCNDA